MREVRERTLGTGSPRPDLNRLSYPRIGSASWLCYQGIVFYPDPYAGTEEAYEAYPGTTTLGFTEEIL